MIYRLLHAIAHWTDWHGCRHEFVEIDDRVYCWTA
jgi:hypothetical protein